MFLTTFVSRPGRLIMQTLFHSDALVSRSRFGLARYASELYEGMLARGDDLALIPFSSRVDADAGHIDHLRDRGYVHPGWRHRTLVMNWATFGYPLIERWAPDADLVHSVELDYPVATRLPWLVTVHDLGPLTHPEFFSQSHRWLRRRGLKAAANRADVIMAVSNATATAIEDLAGSKVHNRLRVIPEAVHPVFFAEADSPPAAPLPSQLPIDTPYFLWAGSMNPRKNLGAVVSAFERIADSVDEHLVLVGGLAWDNQGVLRRIAESPHADRIHQPGFVSDEQLRALYRGATAFVYVSLLEGFGLPILEAMASRCPVVTSNCSSMPEVAGDAGLLVDPLNVTAIAEVMHGLAADTSLASRCRDRGRQRAEGYSWARVADEVIAAYADAVPGAREKAA